MTVALPKSVRVGCFDYAIEEWDTRLANAAERFGECDRLNNVIRVRTDMPPARVAEVLLHEVLHVIWEVGCCDSGDEEKVVSILAMVQCQVWRDNPDLIAFMTKMMCAKP